MLDAQQAFSDFVDTLTNNERIELREKLKEQDNKLYLCRALWYNYETQEMID